MAHPMNNWKCSGAYDQTAYATLIEAFDHNGKHVGFLLQWGYTDGRTFTCFYSDAETAMKSGYEWVLGCDWLDAPDVVREMYMTKEDYVAGTING
jgi:putative intracellular protease/amidase